MQDRNHGATKGKCKATTASNLGGHKAESGHEERTIEKRRHWGHAQANALNGNKTSLMLRSLGTWRRKGAVWRSGYLDRWNVD